MSDKDFAHVERVLAEMKSAQIEFSRRIDERCQQSLAKADRLSVDLLRLVAYHPKA